MKAAQDPLGSCAAFFTCKMERNVWNSSLAASLYRNYLDLGPLSSDAVLHPFGIEFDYENLFEGSRWPRIQAVLMPSYRAALVRETGAVQYALECPTELDPGRRTRRWSRLCDAINDRDSMSEGELVLLLRLLSKLCLYRVVLRYSRIPEEAELAHSSTGAELAYLRAQARYVLNIEGGEPYSLDEFRVIAETAPQGCAARLNAQYQMVVQNVKHAYDRRAVSRWLEVHLAELHKVSGDLPDFAYRTLMSRYHRVAGFAPQMVGDREGVVREMRLAEHFAESLEAGCEAERIARLEMVYPVLESRTKEAMWLKDWCLAEARARRLVELCPLDPRARLHLGEVLLAQQKVEDAEIAYRWAARVGPPGAEVAYFMVGQCCELSNRCEEAVDMYLQALRVDPGALSAAQRLSGLLQERPALRSWGKRCLETLEAEKAQGMKKVPAYKLEVMRGRPADTGATP